MKKIIVMGLASLVLFSSTLSFKVSADEPIEADAAEAPLVVEEIVQKDACTYSLTLTTNASQKTIWRLWEDVENWKDYDTILEYSYLADEADFVVGAKGFVKADGAPRTKFELISVDSGNSFVESLKLPLWSTLELKRYVSKNEEGETVFTHEVEFKGFMKRAYYLLLAKTFKKELRLVMGRMRALAESRDQTASEEVEGDATDKQTDSLDSLQPEPQ